LFGWRFRKIARLLLLAGSVRVSAFQTVEGLPVECVIGVADPYNGIGYS
jgi:hypothetical protein